MALALRLNTVHNQDCLEGLKQLGDGVVDLAFADPPFNIGYDYDVYQDKLESDRYLAWSRDWMGQVVRALKPDGTFWLAIGDEYAAELKVMLQRDLQLTCRSWVVWYYTFGVNCKNKFSRSHAHLFHMVKDAAKFTFNTEAIRVPSARQLVYGDSRANPTGRLPDDTWILRPQDLPQGFQAGEDTWYFPRVCGTFKERAGWHGCQMPEQLLGRILRACSNEDELVLDPFAGSGTTLASAKKLKRRYVGFELSEQYTLQVKARLKAIEPGDPLDGAAEPLVSAPTTAAGRRLDEVGRNGGRRRKRVAPAEEPQLPGF
jgi:site-specific DNA-methyltransferase (adenine-specific)